MYPRMHDDQSLVQPHEYLHLMEAQFYAFNQSLLAAQQPQPVDLRLDLITYYLDIETEKLGLRRSQEHPVKEPRECQPTQAPRLPSYSDLTKRNIAVQVPEDNMMEQDVFTTSSDSSREKHEDACSYTTTETTTTSSSSTSMPAEEEEWIEVKSTKKKKWPKLSRQATYGESEKMFVDWRGREIGRRPEVPMRQY